MKQSFLYGMILLVLVSGCTTRPPPEPVHTSLDIDLRESTNALSAIQCILNRDLAGFRQAVPTREEANRWLRSGWTYLHYAADTGQPEFIDYLAGLGASLDPRDPRMLWTPLHLAVRREHPDIVRILLARGAKPTLPDRQGWAPIHHATFSGNGPILQELIQGGASVEASCIGSWPGYRSLHLAALHGIITSAVILLDAGADIDARMPKNQRTPLHAAASKAHTAMVNLLLKRGADATTTDSDGYGVLHLARTKGDAAIIDSLIRYGADLKAKDKHGETPLHTTARFNHLNEVRLLLDRGADLEARNNYGVTPLAAAAKHGHAEMIRYLASRGADFDVDITLGATPLILAVSHNHLDATRALIELGADINKRGGSNDDVLAIAIRKASPGLVELLLSHGADATVSYGTINWSVLHNAAWDNRSDLVDLLIQHGAKVEAQDISGQRPLLIAARRQHPDVIKYLLDAGAEPYGADTNGLTAWHYARMAGLTNMMQLIEHAGGPPPETPELIRVYFELNWPDAKEVLFASQINNWGAQRIPLERKTNGVWYVELDVYDARLGYKFIVDGQWITDPENPKTWTDRGYGSVNSALIPSERRVEDYAPRNQQDGSRLVAVTFLYTNSAARRVHLSGEFNGWNTSSLPLSLDENGVWKREVNLLPGAYGYKYIVDGHWLMDTSHDHTRVVDGVTNSLVQVPEALQLDFPE